MHKTIMILICLIILTGCGEKEQDDSVQRMQAQQTGDGRGPAGLANADAIPARDWTLKDLKGNEVSLNNYKGKKGVVMVFFTTWCAICAEEVPRLVALQDQLIKENIPVEIIGIDVQQPEHVVERYVKQMRINYKVVLDQKGVVEKLYGVPGYPTIVGVDAEGKVIYYDHGLPRDIRGFIEHLAKGALVEEPAATAK